MINSYSTELIGCIVDKKHVSSFMGRMESFFNKTTVSVHFYDSSSIEDVTKKEFDEYDFSNLRIKEISVFLYKNIRKSDYSDGIESKVVLNINSYFNENSISISSSCYEEYSHLKTIVDEWVRSVTNNKRKKFISLCKKDFVVSTIVTTLMVLCTIIGLSHSKYVSIVRFPNFILTVMLLILTYGSVIGFLVSKIKNNYPPTEIDIGEKIYKSRRKWNFWFISTIFLPMCFMVIQFFFNKGLTLLFN